MTDERFCFAPLFLDVSFLQVKVPQELQDEA